MWPNVSKTCQINPKLNQLGRHDFLCRAISGLKYLSLKRKEKHNCLVLISEAKKQLLTSASLFSAAPSATHRGEKLVNLVTWLTSYYITYK